MAVFYDEQRILDEVSALDVVNYLGIKHIRKGSRYSILCPDHDDRHFGSCIITPKGYHCFVCNETKSITNLVMAELNCDKREALGVIADSLGNREDYIKSKSKDWKKEKIEKLPLTWEELKFIGISNNGTLKCIVNAGDKKPDELDKSQYLTEEKVQVNDYCYTEYQTFIRKSSYSLLDLKKEDPELFMDMLKEKAKEKRNICELVLKMFQNSSQENEEIYQLKLVAEELLSYAESIVMKLCNDTEKNEFKKKPQQNKKFAVVQSGKGLF